MGFAQNYGEEGTLIIRKDGREQEFTFDNEKPGFPVEIEDLKRAAWVLYKSQEVTGTRVLDHNGRIVEGLGDLR